MKFYLASRVKNRELVKDIHKKLELLGHTVTSNWVAENNIIPYEENIKAARERSVQCIKDSANCDVFVLLTDEQGAGMYTEMGAAIYAAELKNKPKIYVIGEHINRSMFFFHTSVKKLKSIDDVLEDLKDT